MKDEKQLTTDDMARAGDDVRGRHEEKMAGRAEAERMERQRDEAARQEARRAAGQQSVAAQPTASTSSVPGTSAAVPSTATGSSHGAPLFAGDEAERFQQRWVGIQTAFVDEPRRAVQDADALVAEIMKRLAEVFARERTTLEQQWDRGDNVTTEDLRVALQRYRSFFGRLLAV